MAKTDVGILLGYVRRLLEGRHAAAPDGLLLERFASRRDEAAFGDLMRRYGPLVLGVCRRVLHHEQDAEDVFQATFLVLARHAAKIRKPSSVGSWLYGVAYRLAKKARADSARRFRNEQINVGHGGASPAISSDPSADLSWQELRGVLDEELARLPERYRAPLLLCYFEGQTQDEAARQLQWKKRTVKFRIDRGRKLLRKRLSRRGLALSTALTGSLLASKASAASVPAALADATTKTAILFAANGATAGAVSAQVLALAQGGLRSMVLSKASLITGLVLSVAVIGGTAGWLLSRTSELPQETATLPYLEEGGAGGPADKPAKVDLAGDPLPAGAVVRLGTVRFRHGGWGLQGLAFSPDGKTIISAGDQDFTIKFWEASTGRQLREISTGTLSIRGFAFSTDCKQVGIGGFLPDEGNLPTRGAVRVLDTASGKEVRTFPRTDSDTDFCSLAFSPDGKLLFSLGGRGGILRIEEIASGVEILQQQFPGDIMGNITISPDGSTLAVASGPNTHKLYLWKWQTGEEPRELNLKDNRPRWLAFSPDGKMLAAADDVDTAVRIWDVASGRLLQTPKSPDDLLSASHVAFSPDGKILAATDYGNRAEKHYSGGIHLWDPATGKHLREFQTPGEGAGGLAFSADSRMLAANSGSSIHVWDLRTGGEVGKNDQAHVGSIAGIAVSTQGLVATAGDDHTIRVWDAATGKQRLKLTQGHWVRAVAFSPDGRLLASSGLDDTVRLWDAHTGREIYKLAGHGKLGGRRAVSFLPDSKRFLSWGDDLYLRLWDVTTGKALLEHAIRPGGVQVADEDAADIKRREMFFSSGEAALSRDGRIFVLNSGNNFHVFDVVTGRELQKIDAEGSVMSLAISPDGKLLLASAWGKPVVTKLTDGRIRSSAANDHPICLWELSSGKLLRKIMLPGNGAGPVAFSADGKGCRGKRETECPDSLLGSRHRQGNSHH